MWYVGLTSFNSIASKHATLEGPAVSTVKKAVKLYQVGDAANTTHGSMMVTKTHTVPHRLASPAAACKHC